MNQHTLQQEGSKATAPRESHRGVGNLPRVWGHGFTVPLGCKERVEEEDQVRHRAYAMGRNVNIMSSSVFWNNFCETNQ